MSLKKINQYYYRDDKIEIFEDNPKLSSREELLSRLPAFRLIVKVNGKVVSDISQYELIRIEPVYRLMENEGKNK